MTNFDRIKSMSVEEMAIALDSILSCRYCKAKYVYKCSKDIAQCKLVLKKWLESEVKK